MAPPISRTRRSAIHTVNRLPDGGTRDSRLLDVSRENPNTHTWVNQSLALKEKYHSECFAASIVEKKPTRWSVYPLCS
jgi:hypothetical protein